MVALPARLPPSRRALYLLHRQDQLDAAVRSLSAGLR
jgi:hypothetical protein